MQPLHGAWPVGSLPQLRFQDPAGERPNAPAAPPRIIAIPIRPSLPPSNGSPADTICQRCDDYAYGYERGKSKARLEIEVWDGTHAPTCGCEPCRIVRGIVAKVLNSRDATPEVVWPPAIR